jgi:hypothetical protein
MTADDDDDDLIDKDSAVDIAEEIYRLISSLVLSAAKTGLAITHQVEKGRINIQENTD